MLVHKETMGVIDSIWTGKYERVKGESIPRPVYVQLTLADVSDPENWWEIPSHGPLYKNILRNYPWITPKTNEKQELVGVVIQKRFDKSEESGLDKEALQQEANKRGYKSISKLRRKNLLPFLNTNKE